MKQGWDRLRALIQAKACPEYIAQRVWQRSLVHHAGGQLPLPCRKPAFLQAEPGDSPTRLPYYDLPESECLERPLTIQESRI